MNDRKNILLKIRPEIKKNKLFANISEDEKFQNKMVGTLLYEVIYSISSAISVPLCCEVNTIPLNIQSLNFHKKMEFQKIDEIPFGTKKVAMLIKE